MSLSEYEALERAFPHEGIEWSCLKRPPEWRGCVRRSLILGRLRRGFRCEKHPSEEVVWQRYETVDASLHKAGYLLVLERVYLALIPKEAFPFAAEAWAVVSPQLKAFDKETPVSADFRARLEQICGKRTALSVKPLLGVFTPVNLRNADDKLVARLCLCEMSSWADDAGLIEHGCAMWAEAVRGYENDLKKALTLVNGSARTGQATASDWFLQEASAGYTFGNWATMPISGAESLPRLIRACLEAVKLNEPGMIDDADVVLFQDTYELLCKALGLLELLGEDTFGAKAARQLMEELSELKETFMPLLGFDALSDARIALRPELPPVIQAAGQGVFELVRRRRKEAHKKLADVLSAQAHQDRMAEWMARMERLAANARPLAETDLRSLLRNHLQLLESALDAISEKADLEALQTVLDVFVSLQSGVKLRGGDAAKCIQKFDTLYERLEELWRLHQFQALVLDVIESVEHSTTDVDLAAGAILMRLYQKTTDSQKHLATVLREMDTTRVFEKLTTALRP